MLLGPLSVSSSAAALAFGSKHARDKLVAARSAYHARQNTKTRTLAERALGSPNFYEFLSWYYGVKLYQHEGIS